MFKVHRIFRLHAEWYLTDKKHNWNVSERPKLSISAKIIIRGSLRLQRYFGTFYFILFFNLEPAQSMRWHLLKELRSHFSAGSIQGINTTITLLLSISFTGVPEWRHYTFQSIDSCVQLTWHSIASWVWARHRTRKPFKDGDDLKASKLLSNSDF